MSFLTQSVRLLSRRGQRGRQTRQPRSLSFRPTLKLLEGRILPSALVVLNNSDTGMSGDGSLRGEILAAHNGDKIVFDHRLTGQTITLAKANGELLLDKNLTIHGLGADKLTISGNQTTRVFEIAVGVHDTISDLTIANGLAPVVVDGSGNATAEGGGIFNAGDLNVEECTLSGNSAAVSNGSGIIVGSATAEGGGIFNAGILELEHSKDAGNSAPVGADLYNDSTGAATLHNSVVGVLFNNGGTVTTSRRGN